MIRPMLAVETEPIYLDKLKYPVLASIKLDGIRCILSKEGAFSRSGKLIRNRYIQKCLMNYVKKYQSIFEDNFFDGELLVGETFQSCTSGIMSFEGEPNFTYHVFDINNIKQLIFANMRSKITEDILSSCPDPKIKYLEQKIIYNVEELTNFYINAVNNQEEGIIIRGYLSPYKYGRSTLKEQYLLKLKPFKTAEAKIIGFIEQMHNNNELKNNELGYGRRSSSQDNMIPANTLGSFVVINKNGIQFNIGSGRGLTKELRKEIWNNRGKFLGKIITYKYQEIGTKDLPRIPIFHGFRDEEDM